MKKLSIFPCLLALLAISATPPVQPPEAEISNGIIHARLYLPDPDNGYYRGSRFDWSGVMASLDWKGHQYFGQWFKEYSPTLHDAILGPVEAFDPVDYDAAKTGDPFLKVGIGVLTKTDELPYAFVKAYPIVNGGKWTVSKKSDQVAFVHTLNDKSYSYEYEKTVKLTKNKPELVLTHTLKNTGQKTIETSVYNHNFFVMDNQPTGPGFTVTLPVAFSGDVSEEMKALSEFKGQQLTFLKELAPNEHVFYRDMTAGKTAGYEFKIENHKTGAAVKITSDQPVSKLVFWCAATTVCPEPFIKLKVEPGKQVSWEINYQFYEVEH